MSEKLKLLPCFNPECGCKEAIIHMAVITKKNMWFVECTKDACSMHGPAKFTKEEAIKEWNALPRALTWTTEPPKVTGFFWAIPKNVVQYWTVIKVIDKNGTLLACPAGNPFAHDLSNFRFWAGPIPEPKDPTS